jgi:HK97 gp10 family phage protein
MANDASLTIDDKVVKAKLHALTAFARKQTAERALLAGGLPIQNAAKGKAPKLTNTLGRSIHMETIEKPGTLAAIKIGTKEKYAATHEFGGIISARNATFLHFVIQGEEIFVKSVHMPARPYLRPAMDEQKGAAVRETAAALRTLLRDTL